MARKKLIRRFEPRYGVSEAMLEVEAAYVARELEDYLVLSANDVTATRNRRRHDVTAADQQLRMCLASLGDRPRAALEALFIRDVHHIALLYIHVLQSDRIAAIVDQPVAAPGSAPVPAAAHEPILPFHETLFGEP